MVIEPIVQIEDTIQNGLFARTLFGLNVFAANSIPVEAAQDPRCIFLQDISQRNPSSAHAGLLAFEGDSPDQFLGLGKQSFSEVPIGIYGGTFYYSNEEPLGCFFPKSTDLYTGHHLENLRYAISCDALALYIAPDEICGSQIYDLLSKSIISSQEWLQNVTGLYSVVILSHLDGWHFTAFTQDSARFQLLDRSIHQAKSSIETSFWYVQNKARLHWNSDSTYDNCLKLADEH